MKIIAIASLMALTAALPSLANPLPTPTLRIRQEGAEEAPTPTSPPTSSESSSSSLLCPFSVTVTATRSCTAPACEDPMFCAAMVNLQNFECDCLRKPPTTTTVTPRCPSDCQCTIPTSWVVPKGCNPNAPKGVKGPIKVNPAKPARN